jgi:hypothetical protein
VLYFEGKYEMPLPGEKATLFAMNALASLEFPVRERKEPEGSYEIVG